MTAHRLFTRHTLGAAIAAALAAAAPGAAHAALYDNLAASTDGSDPVFPGPLAQSFNAGTFNVNLHDVQLLLDNGSDSFSGTLTAELFSDNGNTPGSLISAIGSLAYSAISTSGFATYQLVLPSDLLLTANTNYWIELVSSAPNAIEWGWSLDTSGPGVDGTYASNPDLGGAFPVDGNGAYQMQVDVPEPPALPVFASALLLVAMWRRRARG